MSKLKIDELFQRKLKELEVQHKPEYWSKMEKELESSMPIGTAAGTGAVGSAMGKIYLFIGIATVISVGTIIGLFSSIHSTKSELSAQKIDNQSPITLTSKKNNKKDPVSTVKYSSNGSEESNTTIHRSLSAKKTISKVDIRRTSTKDARIKTSHKAIVNTRINNQIRTHKLLAKTSKASNGINKTKSVDDKNIRTNKVSNEIIITDLITIDENETFFVYTRKPFIKYIKTKNKGKYSTITSSNQLITIYPINKPIKRVFRKRRSFLQRLGIKK